MTHQEMAAILRDAGWKVTSPENILASKAYRSSPAAIAVLEVIGRKEHWRVAEVIDECKKVASAKQVYNAIGYLCGKKVVERTTLGAFRRISP